MCVEGQAEVQQGTSSRVSKRHKANTARDRPAANCLWWQYIGYIGSNLMTQTGSHNGKQKFLAQPVDTNTVAKGGPQNAHVRSKAFSCKWLCRCVYNIAS